MGFLSNAQGQLDSLEKEKPSQEKRLISRIFKNPERHSVQRAVVYSALVPGLGQAYNKKYWKIPLVYAALGATGYFVLENDHQYRYYYGGLERLVLDSVDIFEGRYSPENLIFIANTYRRWRDLSALLFIAAYGLNILDAYVDAHFYYYDISDKLSLRIKPSLQQVHTAFIPGVQITFIFDSGISKKSQNLSQF
ncbi:hypothetical protein JCM31826_16160 [Thermaurantimonas aggregans]|uniref:DUF5683 domain-containing protein n=2 Tax=Thermaurantimonas aggregans TaxID=2173829 RepID=A0A401XMA9_9FLAO|nr:DUF5683 domain-containing protein [Thermaurantimonas aggregans]GCD78134.1 hypothetical protein JCM31826_16160 [Thermaurantimonas aggregans]